MITLTLRAVAGRYCFAGALFGTSICATLSSSYGKTPRSNVDHLVPVGQMVTIPYQLLLARQLYLTSADYVRVVVIPSGTSEGETAISLHSRPENSEEAVLTCTKGDRDIWSAASELDPMLRRDPPNTISRADAGFPKALAVSVSKAIRTLIEHSKEATSSDRVTLHGTHILFMIDDSDGRTLQARLAPESRGKNTSALRNLTQVLMAYCKATPEDRRKQGKRIEGEVRKLSR